jgi:membrane protease YdiL (CAAX protease family)
LSIHWQPADKFFRRPIKVALNGHHSGQRAGKDNPMSSSHRDSAERSKDQFADSRTESAWRLVAIAAISLLLAAASMFLTMTSLSVVTIVFHIDKLPVVASSTARIGALGFDSVLLVIALTRSRIVGCGDSRAGLGDAPVSNAGFVTAMGVILALYSFILQYAIHRSQSHHASILFTSFWLFSFEALLAAFVFPISEELFFRGWLWTGLRKHWSVAATICATSLLWLAMHLPGGILAIGFLLPVAIMLAVTRHIGRSVRAPIALHSIYNSTVVGSVWVFSLLN